VAMGNPKVKTLKDKWTVVTVDGKDPKQVTREIDEGIYDALLAKYEEQWEAEE